MTGVPLHSFFFRTKRTNPKKHCFNKNKLVPKRHGPKTHTVPGRNSLSHKGVGLKASIPVMGTGFDTMWVNIKCLLFYKQKEILEIARIANQDMQEKANPSTRSEKKGEDVLL